MKLITPRHKPLRADVMRPPIQARHISYHWDGSCIDMIKDYTNDKVYALDE